MARTLTVRVWNGSSQSSKDAKLYTSLSSINSAINTALKNENIPSNGAEITSVKLKVNAGYSGGIAPKVYMTFGLGNVNAFNVTLFNRYQISNGGTYPASGVEIIDYFYHHTFPSPGVALDLANYGSYFVVRLDTANIGTPTMKVNWVDVVITYHIYRTLSVVPPPENEGLAGVAASMHPSLNYWDGRKVGLYAEPNTGYKFGGWYKNGVLISTENPYFFYMSDADEEYTVEFILDKINKLFVDTSQPSAIYIDTQEVKGVYIDTTKVYG